METNREKRSSKFSSGGSGRRRVPPNGMGHAGSGEVIPTPGTRVADEGGNPGRRRRGFRRQGEKGLRFTTPDAPMVGGQTPINAC